MIRLINQTRKANGVSKLSVGEALMNAVRRAFDNWINSPGHFQTMIDLRCDCIPVRRHHQQRQVEPKPELFDTSGSLWRIFLDSAPVITVSRNTRLAILARLNAAPMAPLNCE